MTREGITITDFQGNPGEYREYHVDWDASAAEKGGYDYFMLKEIAEQPKAVADTLLGRIDANGSLTLDELRIDHSVLREIDKVVIVACGTAFHAGLIAKYAIEHWARIPCEVEVASEFRYRDPILDQTDAGHRHLAVRRDHGHADGAASRARAGRQGAGHLQHQRFDDPARVGRRALHARRSRGRRRVDQGVPDPAGRLLPGRPLPGPGPRHQVGRRDLRGDPPSSRTRRGRSSRC